MLTGRSEGLAVVAERREETLAGWRYRRKCEHIAICSCDFEVFAVVTVDLLTMSPQGSQRSMIKISSRVGKRDRFHKMQSVATP